MLICGLKCTHDGGVAIIEDGSLRIAVEEEKVDNQPRYSSLDTLDRIEGALARCGVKRSDVDLLCIDGWHDGRIQLGAPDEAFAIAVGDYQEPPCAAGSLDEGLVTASCGRVLGDYHSWPHTAGHVWGAYLSSSFAAAGEDSYVLVWDGGMLPRLYLVKVSGEGLELTFVGPMFALTGNVYAQLAMRFEPFRSMASRDDAHLSVAGKVLGYTSYGALDPALLAAFESVQSQLVTYDVEEVVDAFELPAARAIEQRGATVADVLHSFEAFLCEKLVAGLKRGMGSRTRRHLCLTGGCALNIKWNAAIRASGVADDIWVCPFPNDSGSAIGAACAGMRAVHGRTALAWDAYRGPSLRQSSPGSEWRSRPCSASELGAVLAETGEPVIVLHGRAELGPRALGNRSIVAAATDAKMRTKLNEIKDREWYRPIAPICLEDRAPQVFSPGVPDRLMLFNHEVRPEWRERIPAVTHVDGSSRLQTVNPSSNPTLHEILTAYDRHTGIPVLCNTSANEKGRGFFPDVESAARWGRVRFLWCDGTLHERG